MQKNRNASLYRYGSQRLLILHSHEDSLVYKETLANVFRRQLKKQLLVKKKKYSDAEQNLKTYNLR